MHNISRRATLLGAGSAVLALAGCANGIGGGGAEKIDARVDATRDFLFETYPGTQDLAMQARGILYMPVVTEAGLIYFGGGYGQGALRINDISVDFYSATRASVGLQLGAQQYSHALFFMTEEALNNFRTSDGWAVGADARYATPDGGASLGKETTERNPVVALVFGQSGLIAGASLAGIKYSRILP